VLPEPPDVEPLPPEVPLVEVISTVEGPPDVEPLVPDVEPEPPLVEPETMAGPPEEPPLVPDTEVSRDDVPGPPESRFRLSSTSRHRRWVGRAFRLAWGLVQRSFSTRVKRVSAIGRLSFEAGASRHRGGI
jgi:hypothetical protein